MFHHGSATQVMAEKEAVSFFRSKLQTRIKNGVADCSDTLQKIEKNGADMEDFVVPWGGVQSDVRFGESDGVPTIRHKAFGDRKLHPHATTQAAAKLGMPSSWIRGLAHSSQAWHRALGVRALDEFVMRADSANMLVRSIGDEVRGILSDRYRRLDSSTILASFLGKVKEEGGAPVRAVLDPTRVYVEAVLPHIFPVETAKNGTEYVAAGVVYRTSDFGDGADCVSGWLERMWCTNKAISTSQLRQVHLGSRLPIEHGFRPSRKTYVHDTMTHASLVADVVGSVLSASSVRKHIEGIQRASDEEVSFDSVAKYRLPRMGLTKNEIGSVQAVLADNSCEIIPEGPLTMWKLSQAISAIAQSHAPARRYDLEEMAGKMVFANN